MLGPPPPASYDEVWRHVYGDLQEVGPTHRHMRRLLREVLEGLDYDSVLDVGCGAGHNFAVLDRADRPRRLVGVDVSDEALRRARERIDGDFHRLDIETDRLEGTWDLVFSSLVLEHLPDDLSALRNMRAMTGKWLVVSTIAGDIEPYRAWEEQMGHVRNYRRGELESKLEQTGFSVERVIYWGFPFYSPLARRLQNRMTSEPSYGVASRMIASAMYAAYFLNSSRRGDLLLAVARPGGSDGT